MMAMNRRDASLTDGLPMSSRAQQLGGEAIESTQEAQERPASREGRQRCAKSSTGDQMSGQTSLGGLNYLDQSGCLKRIKKYEGTWLRR